MKQTHRLIALMLPFVTAVPDTQAQNVICRWEKDGGLLPATANMLTNFGAYRLPADANSSIPAGQAVTDWHEYENTLSCSGSGGNGSRVDAYYTAEAGPATTLQFEGKTYSLIDASGYETMGAGVISEIQVNGRWLPHVVGGSTSTPNQIGTMNLVAGANTIRLRFRIIGLGKLIPEGRHYSRFITNISTINYRILPPSGRGGGNVLGRVWFNLSNNRVTCRPLAVNQNVTLGSFSPDDAPGIGNAWPRDTAFGFRLSCPANSPGVTVGAVFTDAAAPSSQRTTLTLTGAARATGVGVRLLQEDGTPIQLAPEDFGPTAPGYFRLFTAPQQGVTDHPVSFSAQLVQTEATVTAGDIQAAALVTLSYD